MLRNFFLLAIIILLNISETSAQILDWAYAFGGGEAAYINDLTAGVIFEHNEISWNYWPVDQPVYAMDTYADSTVWAVGDSGYVVVNVIPSTLHVENQDKIEEINVYPNPFKNELNIEITSFSNPTLKIMDTQGKIIDDTLLLEPVLNLEHLDCGIYILIIEDGFQSKKIRIIKQ